MPTSQQPISSAEINEMGDFIKIINAAESTNANIVETTTGSCHTPSTGINTNEVKGMDLAIKALYEAERIATTTSTNNSVKVVETQTIDSEKDSDYELEREMSYESVISINRNHDSTDVNTYNMKYGLLNIIKKSYSKNALEALKKLIESGYSFENPMIVKLIKNISIQTAAKNTITESKNKYKEYKSRNNVSGMNEQKRIYNDAKQQYENVTALLNTLK